MSLKVTSLNLPDEIIDQLINSGTIYVSDLTPEQKTDAQITCALRTPATTTAYQLFETELQLGYLLTYSDEALDELLKNEIRPTTVVELTGYPGSGKSQICFLLSISVQLPKSLGGFGMESLFISTNGSFSSERIKELAGHFITKYKKLLRATEIVETNELSTEWIMKHIHVIQVNDFNELVEVVDSLDVFLTINNVGLIIIDSFTYPLRTVGTEKRSQFKIKILRDLLALSQTLKFSIVITNDLTTRISRNIAYHTPALAETFYHQVNTRIFLSKKTDQIFHAKVQKSLFGCKECDFVL